MKQDLYRYPALWPVLPHREGRALPAPLLFARRGNGTVELSWEPETDAWAHVIYRAKSPRGLGSARSIVRIGTGDSGAFRDTTEEQWFYAVTVLDRYKRESRLSKAVYDFVVPLRPGNGDRDTWGRVCFKWEAFAGAEYYHIQVATDKDLERIVYQESLLGPTTLRKALPRDRTYYWRVKADNNDTWSPVWSFRR
jgi:hypothetical protein